MSTAFSTAQFEQRLRALGCRYHIHHPFQQMMYAGTLTQKQMQAWVANRYYYQVCIPIKDANVLANCPDPLVRREWVQRILDHDGRPEEGTVGGIEAWIQLGLAVGLTRDEITSQSRVLPGVRFAVDAYVNFVRRASWQEAVCSSLTEMFAPTIHKQRLDSWPDRYPWIAPEGLKYFRTRIKEAHRDVDHGLALTLAHFNSAELQLRAMEILQFKLDILWSLLDALYLAYVVDKPPYHTCEEPQL